MILTRILVVVDRAAPWHIVSWVRRLLAPVGGEVRLLVMLPPARAVTTASRTIAFVDQVEDSERLRAQAALAGIVTRLRSDGLVASVEVRFGQAATTAVQVARDWGAQAIAVVETATNGWRGWLTISVAEDILELAPMPVLVVRASGQRSA